MRSLRIRALGGLAAGILVGGCAALSGLDQIETTDDCGACADADLDSTIADEGVDDTRTSDTHAEGAVDARDAGDAADAPKSDAPTDGADAPRDVVDAGDTLDAVGADTTVDADAADTTPPVTCPTGTGPTMVGLPSGFCIDSTEVTNDDYLAFLAASVPFAGQPAECAWNTSWTPPSGWGWPPSASEGNFPVVTVDWCDANAYCTWAGKHLCGAQGSVPTPFADYADPTKSEWFYACSADGTRTYPYGSTYSPSACEGGDVKPNRVIAVASKTTCEGGYPGIFDMSGNVYEWDDSCDGTTGDSDNCHMRGGGDISIAINLLCANSTIDLRKAIFLNVGIRCCAY